MKQPVKEEAFLARYAQQKNLNEQELITSFYALEQTTAFFTKIPALLTKLHAEGYTLHILSNCGLQIQTFIQKNQEVFNLFTTKNFSYEIGYTKPQIEAFKTVLKQMGVQPHECVMIGDNKDYDILPARQLGLHTIHFVGRTQEPADIVEKLAQIRKTL